MDISEAMGWGVAVAIDGAMGWGAAVAIDEAMGMVVSVAIDEVVVWGAAIAINEATQWGVDVDIEEAMGMVAGVAIDEAIAMDGAVAMGIVMSNDLDAIGHLTGWIRTVVTNRCVGQTTEAPHRMFGSTPDTQWTTMHLIMPGRTTHQTWMPTRAPLRMPSMRSTVHPAGMTNMMLAVQRATQRLKHTTMNAERSKQWQFPP